MNVLIVCGSGMSSSALKQRMKDEISRKKLDMKVGACGISQIYSHFQHADIILVAPQISYMIEEIRKRGNIRCMIIPEKVYGEMNGSALVEMVLHPNDHAKTAVRKSGFSKAVTDFAANRYVLAIMDGFRMILPVSMIGSVFSLLAALPIPYLSTWIASSRLGEFLNVGIDMTLGMISLYLGVSISLCFALQEKISKEGLVLATVIDLMALSGISQKGILTVEYLDESGMLTAILVASLTFKIYRFVDRWMERKRINVISDNIISSFYSLIPVSVCMIMTILFSGFFRFFFHMYFTQWGNSVLVTKLGDLVGNNLFTLLVLNTLATVLWFFGIHGGKITGAIKDPIYKSLSLANLHAWQNGQPLPYTCISQSTMVYMFGGAGSTLMLAFLMLFFSKSRKLKELGKISFPMGIFFINEPLIFGLPLTLNLTILPSFILIPLLSGGLSLVLTLAGILPKCIGFEMPWTTPPLISGMIQGGWKLMIWQMILLVLQTVMWYPVFRKLDREALQEEKQER